MDEAMLASELRVVVGQLIRRLRVEHGFPLSQGSVLGRLDREGTACVSDLAAAERVRPQSMATTVSDLEDLGLVARRPDPSDRRRQIVELTQAGHDKLLADRAHREGWLAQAISEQLSPYERGALERAIPLLGRLADL